MKGKILLVEDEESIAKSIQLNLELEGFQVTLCSDGEKVMPLFRSNVFDLIILDIMLPGIDGITLCKSIRLLNPKVPILILSAKNSGDDKVSGLRSGADDYLTKPFNLEEFLLRVQNLLKRNSTGLASSLNSNTYSFGNNEINFSTYEIKNNLGEMFSLTKKEIQLLKLLIDRKGEVVSRDEIIRLIWGHDAFPTTRTIDNYILSFRKYFEPDQRNPVYFHSIRGVGYKFTN